MPTVQELFGLTGRTALVTGAAGHLGRAMAHALAEAGASVIVTSRDLSRARQVAEELPVASGCRHQALVFDHHKDRLAAALEVTEGIDILINNGITFPAGDLTNLDREGFQSHLENATSYFLLARDLRDHAVARGKAASIVMIGSMYGLVGSYPDVYEGIAPASSVAYQVEKAGVIQMTRHLAVYWARDGVRVNCLTPGPFPRPEADPKLVERLRQKSPMNRMGRPEELKGAVVLLASDAGSYLTGHNLVVDGGWTAW